MTNDDTESSRGTDDRASGTPEAPSSETDDPVVLRELETLWEHSTGAPFELFDRDDPAVQTGTYVIRPGERVPESGTTAHSGPEISVLLSGEIVLGLPKHDRTYEATGGTLSVIPAGVEHYSHNRGSDPVRLVYTILGEL